ncbi:DUF7664 domain-containing protein [Natranaerobius thermophilus]|uniref:DUF7664 domain-containing protein n=1 Tax=Natranaerobius thermophilus (strain ATCC BAA-1301 / DSM 18059 / JW/NM-WN-LF) TaxID=457570 RepID=B2A7U9_NATTJ|nr:N-glycosylase/DNA lyase [Natranaerobius thermophilus]ACB84397.1 conserved hypothetical protein [Natranaerobius thermophilus JW/NM-WN-LF]
MSSKYDIYWKKRINDIAKLIQEAKKFRYSSKLSVNDLVNYGKRKNWYGVVEVHQEGVNKGEMAHARSLGNIVYDELNYILDDKTLKLTVTSDLQLMIELVIAANTKVSKGPGEFNCENNDQIQEDYQQKAYQTKEEIQVNQNKVVDIFKDIPWDVWECIVKVEPEWVNMIDLLRYYDFGTFSTLMVVAGLNDFQLKGKAEKAYWMPLREQITNTSIPSTPYQLAKTLEPFYRKERHGQLKIERLHKFLNSNLANLLWNNQAQNVAKILPYIWRELAKTMNQDYNAKTIVFAMKCLGLSLLMVGENGFDFARVPIPVDIRVLKLTKNLGLCKECNESEVQRIWSDALKQLRNYYPEITMIHLDSLVWQIASLDKDQLKTYFEDLGILKVANNLLAFQGMSNLTENNYKIISNHKTIEAPKLSQNKIFKNFNQKENIVCVIPCCKSKKPSGDLVKPERSIKPQDIPETWGQLRNGRKGMEYSIDFGTSLTTAIHLYTGHFYKPLFSIKEQIINKIQKGEISILIISAGYGILNALEPIHNYDELMKGRVASWWKKNRLENVLSEYLLKKQPDKVYGFFAGGENWNFNSSSYRFFYTEGVKIALRKGLKSDVGCFYRKEGMGASSILGVLGHTMKKFLEYEFDDNFVKDVMQHDRKEKGIVIGYRPFV